MSKNGVMPKNVAFSNILHNGNQPKSVINRRVNVARLDRVADAEQLKTRWAATECLRLAGNQRVNIQWNFTSISPDQYQTWSIAGLTNPSHSVLSMQWQNDVGASLGEIAVVPSVAGSVDVALSSLTSVQMYRVSFSGLSLGMSESDMQGVNFTSVAVPSAGPVALLTIAGLASKRRRA